MALLFFNQSILNLISSEFVAKLANQVGGAGVQRFSFEAIRKGKTSIRIVYKRAWQNEPVKSNEFLVNVI